jgi:putative ABC transport system permease protein
MKSTRTSMLLGVLGTALLLLFWLSSFLPRQMDALLRPYGLFIWLAVLGITRGRTGSLPDVLASSYNCLLIGERPVRPQITRPNYPSPNYLTWSQALPEGSSMVQGTWWDRDDGQSLVVTEHIAQRLHLHLGSHLVFTSNGRTIQTSVIAIIRHNGQHVYSRSEFILTPRALAGLPVVWYGAVHVDPRQVGVLQRALFNAYPTVTVINIADVIETIQGVVQQITIVVRFLAAFSILAGAVILASSIASTQFRRVREVVVLKTLGAKRNHIAAVFSVEFIVLGLLAGLVGVIFANLLSRVLLHRLDVVFHIEWLATIIALIGTAILATATGWVASFRMLGQKPLQVLREE